MNYLTLNDPEWPLMTLTLTLTPAETPTPLNFQALTYDNCYQSGPIILKLRGDQRGCRQWYISFVFDFACFLRSAWSSKISLSEFFLSPGDKKVLGPYQCFFPKRKLEKIIRSNAELGGKQTAYRYAWAFYISLVNVSRKSSLTRGERPSKFGRFWRYCGKMKRFP